MNKVLQVGFTIFQHCVPLRNEFHFSDVRER